MEKKTYQVLDQTEGKSIHDYDIVVDEKDRYNTVYTLIASNGTHWSENIRGKEMLTIVDTGNDYLFPKLKPNIDYSMGMEIFLLMSFIHNKRPICKYDIVESKKIISL